MKTIEPMNAHGHDSKGTKYWPDMFFPENSSAIFNYVILQGIYPDAMEVGKVIALKSEKL